MDNKKKSRNAIILIYIYVVIANGMFVIALWITNNLFKSWAVIALIVIIILDIIGCIIWTKHILKKYKE